MRRVLVAFFLCLVSVVCANAGNGKADVSFASRKIKQLASLLPMRQIPDRDTIIAVPQVIKNKSLVFLFNDRKEVSHIGLSLFSDATKLLLDKSICNFLERCLLELLLQESNQSVQRKLTEYHIGLFLDGKAYGKGNMMSLSNMLELMEMPVNFSLRHKDKQAEAYWKFGHHTLSMSFPLYRELIDGTDKKESDDNVYHQLQVAVFDTATLVDKPVDKQNLQPIEGGKVWVNKGEVFAVQPLSSNRYYVWDGNQYVPLFQKEYVEYSANNLFQTYQNGKGKFLLITHRKYGQFTPEITIPLLNFLKCFADDFITYSYTGYNRKGNLETIVVFSHKKLNYIHLLKVSLDAKQLFATNPVLKADFYSNIPQQYIKTLLQ